MSSYKTPEQVEEDRCSELSEADCDKEKLRNDLYRQDREALVKNGGQIIRWAGKANLETVVKRKCPFLKVRTVKFSYRNSWWSVFLCTKFLFRH